MRSSWLLLAALTLSGCVKTDIRVEIQYPQPGLPLVEPVEAVEVDESAMLGEALIQQDEMARDLEDLMEEVEAHAHHEKADKEHSHVKGWERIILLVVPLVTLVIAIAKWPIV